MSGTPGAQRNVVFNWFSSIELALCLRPCHYFLVARFAVFESPSSVKAGFRE